MIFDDTAVRSMAQAKANQDNQPISIYQRVNGEYIIARNILIVKQMLGITDKITYIDTISPEVTHAEM